jgi:hypothetical protein
MKRTLQQNHFTLNSPVLMIINQAPAPEESQNDELIKQYSLSQEESYQPAKTKIHQIWKQGK